MKIYLSSFASSDLSRSADRFRKQAEKIGIYHEINIFNENDLSEEYRDYVFSLIRRGKKLGFGYWVWQSYFHRLVLSKMEENDIYQWSDIGNHLNKNGVNRLKEYINIVLNSKSGILGFDYSKPHFESKYSNYEFPELFEYQYTKADLIKYFNLTCEDKIIQSPALWGGSFLLKKCKIAEEVMAEHYNLCRNRFDLIDDDESKFLEKSCKGYIQHRHPQSVLSILFKMNNCELVSAYESEWALNENKVRTFSHLEKFPIIARRDKKRNILLRFLDRQKKTLNRYKNRFKIFLNNIF